MILLPKIEARKNRGENKNIWIAIESRLEGGE
jgi:hypothetical protein